MHLGYTDTDMTRRLNVIKNDLADVARSVLDGPEDGRSEVSRRRCQRQVEGRVVRLVTGLSFSLVNREVVLSGT